MRRPGNAEKQRLYMAEHAHSGFSHRLAEAQNRGNRPRYRRPVSGYKLYETEKQTKEHVVMRKGFKIYDADTHVSASAEALEPYLGARVRELIPDLDERKAPIRIGLAGEVRQEPFRHSYRLGRGGGMEGGWGGSPPRILGEAAPREN